MPTDKTTQNPDLSRLLHSGDTPRSPGDLDARILRHARQRADEYRGETGASRFGWLGENWKTAAAFASVGVIAVSVTLQVSNNEPLSLENAVSPQVAISETDSVAPALFRERQATAATPSPAEPDQAPGDTARDNADTAGSRALAEEIVETEERNALAAVQEQVLNRSDLQPANEPTRPAPVSPLAEPPATVAITQAEQARQAAAPVEAQQRVTASADSAAVLADARNTAATEPAAAASADAEVVEEVVVTGSAIRRSEAFTQASAVQTVEPDGLQSTESVNPAPTPLAEFLARMNRTNQVPTPLGLVSAVDLPDNRERLQRTLALVAEVLSGAGLDSPAAVDALDTVAGYGQLVARTATLVAVYDSEEARRRSSELQSAYQQAAAEFEAVGLPPSLDATLDLLGAWQAAQ